MSTDELVLVPKDKFEILSRQPSHNFKEPVTVSSVGVQTEPQTLPDEQPEVETHISKWMPIQRKTIIHSTRPKKKLKWKQY